MRVHLATSLFGALLTAFLAVPALAQPTVTSLSPAAVPPGKTVEVTLVGTKLDDPLSIWTSFPAKVEPVPPAEAKPGQTKRVVHYLGDHTAPPRLAELEKDLDNTLRTRGWIGEGKRRSPRRSVLHVPRE